jgi:hypothetical protein
MAQHDDSSPKRVQMPARVELTLVDAVRSEAKKNRRTIGQELALIIEEALEARGVTPGKPARRKASP